MRTPLRLSRSQRTPRPSRACSAGRDRRRGWVRAAHPAALAARGQIDHQPVWLAEGEDPLGHPSRAAQGQARPEGAAHQAQLAQLGLQLAAAADVHHQFAAVLAHQGGRRQIEHHPPAGPLNGTAHLHQVWAGQAQAELLAVSPHADAQGLQQGQGVERHFIGEGLLGGRGHLESLAEPLQIQAAVRQAAAAHAQLVLQHLQGEPELLGWPCAGADPAPAGLLAAPIDHQGAALLHRWAGWLRRQRRRLARGGDRGRHQPGTAERGGTRRGDRKQALLPSHWHQGRGGRCIRRR